MLTLSRRAESSRHYLPDGPAAVITGHVYDEDGEPIEYAQVSAMHYMYVRGQRQLMLTSPADQRSPASSGFLDFLPGSTSCRPRFEPTGFRECQNQQGYVPVLLSGSSRCRARRAHYRARGSEFSGVDISLQPFAPCRSRGMS